MLDLDSVPAPGPSCSDLKHDSASASMLQAGHRPSSKLVPKWVGYSLLRCSGSGCREEPEEIVDVRLGLCLCTWSQLLAVCSAPRQDGSLCCNPGTDP